MLSHHGRLPEFSSSGDKWDIFAEKLMHYVTANDITDGNKKKRAILLSMCGATAYKLLVSLVELTSKLFDELVQLAREHHSPKPSVVMCRFWFNTCVCQEGESIAGFVARLHELALQCEYGETAKKLIRDHLVGVIWDDVLQHSLFTVNKLTYDKAYTSSLCFMSPLHKIHEN